MDRPLPFGEELFVIPRGADRYYLYAPLRRVLAEANTAAIRTVADYLANPDTEVPPRGQAVIDQLRAQGLFRDPAPALPVFPASVDFRPHEVTLFPTSRCNLRCRYCYADAGFKAIEMPWPVARAAIDLVSANAGLLGSRKFAIGFHGGGEPMLAWDLVVRCVDYARERADALGLDVEVFTATNGLLSPQQRQFLAEHFTTANVSFDGPADIQDYNRPTLSGGGSYEQVADTLQEFDRRGFSYGLRTTITADTVGRMSEIVESIASRFRAEYLHIEPVWQCGRCAMTGERPPSEEQFVREFLRAREKGVQRGIRVFYSGARLDVLTSKFCAAPGDGFSVLPEGIATSCYEITETSDPRAAIFHYGRYVPETDAFEFDQARIQALQGYSVEHLPYCRDCFCRWHCAGDCLAKVFEKSGQDKHEGSDRCTLNRALTLAGLEELIGSAAASRDEAVSRDEAASQEAPLGQSRGTLDAEPHDARTTE